MKRDYYEILGVAKGASLQEIKKAYRSLALKKHPDRVAPEKKKQAEEEFKEISEAYGVLSDSQKRSMYDQYGHAGIDQRYTTEDIFKGADFGSVFEGSGLGDIFSKLFGEGEFDFFGGGASGRRHSQKGRDILYEVELDIEEAYAGVKKKIKVPRNEHCKQCDGSGAKSKDHLKTCPTCNGQGQVFLASGFFRMAQTCSSCRGLGKIITANCPQCQGRGVVRVTRQIEVSFPAGVDNDSQLRVRGEGEVGRSGPGDLYITIRVKPHPRFQRDGTDIMTELPVTFITAALGAEVPVATLEGKVTMKVPAGTQSGKVFRLKGKGMPDLHGGLTGDQYVRVMIQVPTQLTNEQRKLLEEFAKTTGEESAGKQDSLKEKIKKVFG